MARLLSMIISLDIKFMQLSKLNRGKSVSFNSANNPPMLKPCSSSSKSSIEISVVVRCRIPALDHTRENAMLPKDFSIKVQVVTSSF